MQLIGHRGARGLAPMNTKAGILAGLQAGVDWIEFDVRGTKDGIVVLSHDTNTLRVSPWPRIVSRTKYTKLAKAKTYRGQPITTLTEAFKAIGAKAKINVEIKSKGCAPAVVDHIERMVKAGANYERFLVSSFKPERLREIHRLNDHIPLCLLHGTKPLAFLKLRALRLSAVGFWRKRLPQHAIEQAKVRGLTVLVYTINKPRDAERLTARGVDRIVTDRPDLLQTFRD
ncbi:MAG TPA: glycerophosphodiester phosphodiesterase [Magnetospirillaceae bacterium]|nr:glycerophosphodiester phosphodiesterase [Magnetospirillaceae bacterium]